MDFQESLAGGDLRSIGKVSKILSLVKAQRQFDELFKGLFHPDRLIVMRSADAVEKITSTQPNYLQDHKDELLQLLKTAQNKELKWHLALIMGRLSFAEAEIKIIWPILTGWLMNKNESRIVRVNALQALFQITQTNPALYPSFMEIVHKVATENIPSLNARIKLLNLFSSEN